MLAKYELQAARYLLAVTAALLLCGCGFHLRTYSFSGSVESYALVGKTGGAVVAAVRDGLRQAGVDEVSANEAQIVVEFLDSRRDRRNASVGSGARVAEYETSIGVQYRIVDRTGRELVAPTWIERQRVYQVDRSSNVGSSEEQALLEKELVQDVAGQLVRAMDAVSRGQEVAADAG